MNECCDNKDKHPSHMSEINRLNRISGQVEGLKKMINDNRYCLEIITQISAVRAALKSVEMNILERHLNSCVADAMNNEKDRNEKVREIIQLFKKND